VSVTLRGVTYTPRQEPTFRLDSMTAPRRRRTGLIGALIAGGVVLLLGGAGSAYLLVDGKDDKPTVAAPPATSAVATTAQQAPASSAKAACEQLASLSRTVPKDAFTAKDLPAVKVVADAAAGSDSTTIARWGLFLSKRVELADAGQKYPDGAKYIDDVVEDVRSLRQACAEAGYPV
jgi:hypothetical protein